jgi:sugar phosphate isomerase/epimerase
MLAEPSRRSLLKLGVGATAGQIFCSGVADAFFLGRSASRNWQLGANTAIEGYGLIPAIHTVREIGFTAIEIHPMGVPEPRADKFPGFEFDKLDQAQRREIRNALAGFQSVTTHLPYTGLDYMSASGGVRESAVRTVETAMEATAFFGATVAVLHPQSLPEGTLDTTWPSYLDRFRRWGDRARKLGFRITLETGYPRSVREYVRLVKEIDHDSVGSTIDVGHQSRYAELVARVKPEERSGPVGIRTYNETTFAIIEGLGPKVFHFHVHDIDPATWKEHQPLSTGFVDYPELFQVLRRISYQGLLILEISGPGTKMKGLLADNKRQLEALISES